jgi:hypothetical protein
VKDVGGLAKVLAVVFLVAGLAELARAGVVAFALVGIPEEVLLTAYVALLVVAGAAWGGVTIVAVVFSLRLVDNVRSFERDFPESPGSVVLAWLAPFWSLYKPWDLWTSVWSTTGNHPKFGDDVAPPSRLLDLFWVAWIASLVLGKLACGSLGFLDLVGAVAGVVAAGTGAVVVMRLAALQDEVAAGG